MKQAPRERLLAKAIVIWETGCWRWTARTDAEGYGQFRLGGRTLGAHRVAYEMIDRPIPAGLKIDHLCHTNDPTCAGGPTCLHRRCINPAHLEPVTEAENLLRGRSFSAQNAAKTHCPAGHEYTAENTYRQPGVGARQCRACGRASEARYRNRKRTTRGA